jgi:hypothetical protein
MTEKKRAARPADEHEARDRRETHEGEKRRHRAPGQAGPSTPVESTRRDEGIRGDPRDAEHAARRGASHVGHRYDATKQTTEQRDDQGPDDESGNDEAGAD